MSQTRRFFGYITIMAPHVATWVNTFEEELTPDEDAKVLRVPYHEIEIESKLEDKHIIGFDTHNSVSPTGSSFINISISCLLSRMNYKKLQYIMYNAANKTFGGTLIMSRGLLRFLIIFSQYNAEADDTMNLRFLRVVSADDHGIGRWSVRGSRYLFGFIRAMNVIMKHGAYNYEATLHIMITSPPKGIYHTDTLLSTTFGGIED